MSTRRFILALIFLPGLTPTLFAGTTLLTGNAQLSYYAAGKAYCNFLNHYNPKINCTAIPSNGSIENLTNLEAQKYPLGLVQSDMLSWFTQQKQIKHVKFLLKLFPEDFYIVVRANSTINTFDDFRGKKINIGPQGSGLQGTTKIIFQSLGLKDNDFSKIEEQPATLVTKLLCNNQIDIGTFVLEANSPLLKQMMQTCPLRLISIPLSQIILLKQRRLGYQATTIPGSTYPRNPQATQTIQLDVLLLVSDQLNKNIAHEIFIISLKNIDALAKINYFKGLSRIKMLMNPTSLPQI